MAEASKVIKENINLIIQKPHEFVVLFESLKSYAKKFNGFESTSTAVKEITFNNGSYTVEDAEVNTFDNVIIFKLSTSK